MTFSREDIIIIKRTEIACLAQPVEHAAVNRSVGGSSPSTGAKKHLGGGVFFVPERGLSPHARSARLRQAEGTLLPHWTRSTLRVAIAKSENKEDIRFEQEKEKVLMCVSPEVLIFVETRKLPKAIPNRIVKAIDAVSAGIGASGVDV